MYTTFKFLDFYINDLAAYIHVHKSIQLLQCKLWNIVHINYWTTHAFNYGVEVIYFLFCLLTVTFLCCMLNPGTSHCLDSAALILETLSASVTASFNYMPPLPSLPLSLPPLLPMHVNDPVYQFSLVSY